MRAARQSGRAARATAVAVAGVVSLLLAGGCREPTEIIVIADTDMTPFVDFDNIQFHIQNQFFGPTGEDGVTSRTLPATLGIVAAEGGRPVFDLTLTVNTSDPRQPALVTRRVSNIPFVEGEMRAVFVPLLRQCQCDGTACAHALDDECRDITAPVLTDFDDENLPRLRAQAP